VAKRGRPRKSGARDKRDRLILEKRIEPADYVLQRREAFAFVTPTKGPEGRVGTIDQDICDGIGQLHALGLLDGHGHDAQDLRDHGRQWRDGYVTIMRSSAVKIGKWERADRSEAIAHYTHQDAKFDTMDEALTGFERRALMDLLVDPIIGSWPMGEENAPWVRAVIAEGLLKRGRHPRMCMFPTMSDKELLNACIRGLCILIDACIPSRREQMTRDLRSAA
jgi:hypothetical protein